MAFLGIDDPLTDPQNRRVGLLTWRPASRWIATGHRPHLGAVPGVQPPIWDGDGLVVARGPWRRARLPGGRGRRPAAAIGGQRVVTGYDRAGGTMAFTVSTVERPAELYVTVGEGPERRLTTVTERFAARARLQPADRFVAPSTDGVEVDCWVITPPDFDPSQRYPVLLNVHGGPFSQYDRFFDEAQIQAGAATSS